MRSDHTIDRRWKRRTPDEKQILIDSIQHLPVMLDVGQAARLARISVSTVYTWVSVGRLKKSVCRHGGLRFHRDLFVMELLGVI